MFDEKVIIKKLLTQEEKDALDKMESDIDKRIDELKQIQIDIENTIKKTEKELDKLEKKLHMYEIFCLVYQDTPKEQTYEISIEWMMKQIHRKAMLIERGKHDIESIQRTIRHSKNGIMGTIVIENKEILVLKKLNPITGDFRYERLE